MEILATVAFIAVLAGLAYAVLTPARVAVVDTKLRTDVARLNQIIGMYIADGGSLDGLATAQAVIEKLKTVRANGDAKRQVGALTGRGVDVRLTPREQTAEEKATASPRAVWNPVSKRFDIVTTAGTSGIAGFVLDDNLLTVSYPTETRKRTTVLYNDVDGWVWSPGDHRPETVPNPVNAALTVQENVFDPTVAPSPPAIPSGPTSGNH